MNFGERLKKARQNRKLTQKELAELLRKARNEVAHSTISNWENNTNKPDIDTILLLCDLLKTDANYLLGIDKSKEKYNEIIDRNKKEMLDFLDSLTEEQWEEVLDYAGYIVAKEKKDSNKEN